MQSVQHVEEIVARWALPLRVLVREVRDEPGVLHELRIEGLDAQLLVLRHLDFLDLGLLEQMLLAGQDLLEEVLVHLAGRREVVLDCRGVREGIGETYGACPYRRRSVPWS